MRLWKLSLWGIEAEKTAFGDCVLEADKTNFFCDRLTLSYKHAIRFNGKKGGDWVAHSYGQRYQL